MTRAEAALSVHALLSEQLSAVVDANGDIDLDRLITMVSAAYETTDRDRKLAARSIAQMVEELAQLKAQLEADAKERR